MIFIPGFLSLCFYLLANDTTATIVGGKITYTKTDDISIEEELLEISTDEIRVFYRFLNHAKHAVNTDVAFPLPPSPYTIGDTSRVNPSWDESYYASLYLHETNKDSTNTSLKASLEHAAFINFKRTVNKHIFGFNYKIQAIDQNDKDITQTLRKQKIPLSAAYLSGFMDAPALVKEPEIKKKLRRLGLLSNNGWYALWQVCTTYFWKQTFEPGKITEVTHSYRPYVGQHWLTGSICAKNNDELKITHRNLKASGQPETMKISDYCPSKSQQECLLSLFNKKHEKKREDITYSLSEVRYILSTGGNWKGPIKKFRLRITPPHKNCLVFCCFPSALKKNWHGIYTAEMKNFKPTTELKVLFVSVSPAW